MKTDWYCNVESGVQEFFVELNYFSFHVSLQYEIEGENALTESETPELLVFSCTAGVTAPLTIS